jgi:hypothetical protein
MKFAYYKIDNQDSSGRQLTTVFMRQSKTHQKIDGDSFGEGRWLSKSVKTRRNVSTINDKQNAYVGCA